MKRFLVLASLIGGLCQTALLATIKVDEQIVGPVPDGSVPSYTISPAGVRYAILTMKGSRSTVVVDGEAGPLIDELYNATGDRSLTANNSVIFSRGGEHFAYLARVGDDYILIRDGKEVYRGKYWISALRYGELKFSPGGKHLSFVAAEQAPSGTVWHVVMDGKAGPECLQVQPPVFSADDSRWVYLARKVGARDDDWFGVVDGRDAGKIGLRPTFTGDNRLITVSAATASSGPQLLVDGKSVFKATAMSEKIWVARTGPHYAVAAQLKAGAPMTLMLDGKPVSGGLDPQDVVFSPDGKRYLALCHTASGNAIVLTDGKPGQNYQGATGLRFTPDSSKALYQAYNGGKSFLIVEGEESEGFELMAGQVAALALSAKGAHYGYGTLDGMNRTFTAVVDGKNVLPAGRRVVGDSFIFSPDGKRYSFATLPATRNDDAGLFVDGQEVAGIEPAYFMRDQTGLVPYALFSPDSQHLIWRGHDKTNPGRAGLVVNGDLVVCNAGYMIRPPTFTPDSKHVLWLTREFTPGTPPAYQLYVDGKKGPTYEESFEPIMSAWAMGSDGVLQFLAKSGNVIKRYRVTPGDDTSIVTMVADSKAAEAQALADAAKAKKEAEEAKIRAAEAAAAAQAQAKADAEAAYAAKQKAREEAIAAKQKARAEAVAAKQKAREDAAAAKRAKK
jgi:hypothetical protein